jgi:hypothetical protein
MDVMVLERSGPRCRFSTDTVLNQSNTYGYDQFNRLASKTSGNFTYAYNRWGNRWQQTGNGPEPQFTFKSK